MNQSLMDTQLAGGHGGQGSQEAAFTRLLRKDVDYIPLALTNPDETFTIISQLMDQGLDTASDTPDDQENPFVPAAYTYFGQLVDHDLTFDTRSTLENIPHGLSSLPNDERTPRLDLDCLYAEGPKSSAFFYDRDGRLATNSDKPYDLPRARTLFNPDDPNSHRAIIGDPRNDENSMVCQLQLSLIKFHNAMIDHFKGRVDSHVLFVTAQREVRFTYQKVVVGDFLRRIVQKSVYDDFVHAFETQGAPAFKLYKAGHVRDALPLEFTGAAYRFGHSQVRNAYRLNAGFQSVIFKANVDDAADSLVGFGDLPESHKIDWSLFATSDLTPGAKADNKSKGPDGKSVPDDPKRLQFAYKLDTSLVDPLAHLPPSIAGGPSSGKFASLAARNLKRGYNFNLPSGQDVAQALGVTKAPPLLIGDGLVAFNKMGLPPADAAALASRTPLWLYILAEAQACLAKPDGSFERGADGRIAKNSDQGSQLGPVGGRILMEVFFGLLNSDAGSYFQDKSWDPVVKPVAATLTLWDILRFGGSV